MSAEDPAPDAAPAAATEEPPAAETPAPAPAPAPAAYYAAPVAASEIDAAADALEKVGVSPPADPDAPDAPDLALKSDVLVEEPETEVVKTVVSDTPYASAKSFEELGLSEELLRGLYSEMKF